jgi:hypothetical protein
VNPKGFSTIICAVLVSVSSIALAGQTRYRCADRYQDASCDNGEQGAHVGKGASATPAPVQVQVQAQMQAASADCIGRGKDSLKISRAREAGATAETQLAKVDSKKPSPQQAAQERRLIASVYAKRGSSTAIRADIEGECMAEKQRLKQAFLFAAAAAKLMQEVQPDAASSAEPDPTSEPETTQAPVESSQTDARNLHTRNCARLTRELNAVRAQQRSGGSPAAMTKLDDSKRELEAGLRSKGC